MEATMAAKRKKRRVWKCILGDVIYRPRFAKEWCNKGVNYKEVTVDEIKGKRQMNWALTRSSYKEQYL
jgi:hypothetical protein